MERSNNEHKLAFSCSHPLLFKLKRALGAGVFDDHSITAQLLDVTLNRLLDANCKVDWMTEYEGLSALAKTIQHEGSDRAYRCLQANLTLPSLRTLQDWDIAPTWESGVQYSHVRAFRKIALASKKTVVTVVPGKVAVVHASMSVDGWLAHG